MNDTVVDREQQKKIEKAHAYRDMVATWAWRDFARFMVETRQAALEQAVQAKTMEDVQMARGIVRGIDDLTSEVNFIMDGPK